MHPGDLAAARDALWSSELTVDEELGLVLVVADVTVDLDSAGRPALADYDAAAQARRQRSDFVVAQIDVVRSTLADADTALAWLIRQNPAQLESFNLDQVLKRLDTIAQKIRPVEPQEGFTLDDRLLDLVREFLEPFLHPTQRAVLIQSLVAMFRAHGADDLVKRAKAELPRIDDSSKADGRQDSRSTGEDLSTSFEVRKSPSMEAAKRRA
jgi:hypothetical protein